MFESLISSTILQVVTQMLSDMYIFVDGDVCDYYHCSY